MSLATSNGNPYANGEGSPDESLEEAPEALVISALISSGQFDPERYRVSKDDLSCYHNLWTFCQDYQFRARSAPPLNLVLDHYPDFPYLEGIDPTWAASRLRHASQLRGLRTTLRDVMRAVKEDDVATARELMAGISGPSWSNRDPISVLDYATIAQELTKNIPVPYRALQNATGGMKAGDLWYLGARPGAGKTHELCHYAAHAMKYGAAVRYISLEMPVKTIARRIQCHLVAHDKSMLDAVRGESQDDRRRVLDVLATRMDGTLDIVDPSFGRPSTEMVAAASSEVEVVIVDHAGLLQHGIGRVVDDWRAMASASNRMKEIALSTGCVILCAAQLNRDAEGGPQSKGPPKASQLSQADALAQDGDVVITMRRLSQSVMAQGLMKNREGPEPKWWSRFDVPNMRFEEMDKEAAERLVLSDADRFGPYR